MHTPTTENELKELRVKIPNGFGSLFLNHCAKCGTPFAARSYNRHQECCSRACGKSWSCQKKREGRELIGFKERKKAGNMSLERIDAYWAKVALSPEYEEVLRYFERRVA